MKFASLGLVMQPKRILILIIFFLGVTLPSQGHGKSEAFAQLEKDMLVLANVARFAPGSTAELLGLDAEEVFSGIPDYSPAWSEHKWGLRSCMHLQQTALMHAQDMLDRDYISSTSPEGAGPLQRAEKKGYRALEVQEYISILAPRNYISPQIAFLELYTRFFEHQAEALRNGQDNILEYHFRDIGVSFKSGKLTLNNRLADVYLLVVNYGLAEDYLIEYDLMSKINFSRVDHNFFIEYFELDKKEIARALNGFLLINIMGGLSPYVFYSDTADTQMHVFDDVAEKSLRDFEIKESLEWTAEVPRDAEPAESARILFDALLQVEGLRGVKAIFDTGCNAATVRVHRHEADDEQDVLLRAEFTAGYVRKQPDLWMGWVCSGQETADPFVCGPVPEDVRVVLLDHEKQPVSRSDTGKQGYFRLTQNEGLKFWEVRTGQEVIESGGYQAESRPRLKNIFISEQYQPGAQILP